MKMIQFAGNRKVAFGKWLLRTLMRSLGVEKFNLPTDTGARINLLNKLSDGNRNCMERREVSVIEAQVMYLSLPLND